MFCGMEGGCSPRATWSAVPAGITNSISRGIRVLSLRKRNGTSVISPPSAKPSTIEMRILLTTKYLEHIFFFHWQLLALSHSVFCIRTFLHTCQSYTRKSGRPAAGRPDLNSSHRWLRIVAAVTLRLFQSDIEPGKRKSKRRRQSANTLRQPQRDSSWNHTNHVGHSTKQ